LNDLTNYDLTPRIDAFSEYNTLQLSVNGVIIDDKSIIDLQINYSKEEKGFLSFTDSIGIIEIAPLSFGIIDMLLIDSIKNKITKKYIITKAETIRTDNNLLTIDIEFEEYDTYRLKNTFISRSYKELNILEIIEKVFNELEIDSEFIDKDKIDKYEYFAIPGNISFYDFILKHSKIADFDFYVDRIGWIFGSKDSFNFSNLKVIKEDIFSFTSKNPFWKILEYKGDFSNIKEVRKCTDMYLTNPDIMDLKYKPDIIKISDIYETQKLNNGTGFKNKVISDLITNIGEKQTNHIYNTPIKGDNIDYREYIKKSQDISIAVQGVLSIRMYGVINIDLPRSTSNNDSNPDSVFSGKFVVTDVVDKFMAGKYLQILYLKSSDYGSFKE